MTEPGVTAGLARPDPRPVDRWHDAVVYQVYPRSFADSVPLLRAPLNCK